MTLAQTQVYQLSKEVLDRFGDYTGCGKAWAAVKDGEVVAIRYVEDNPFTCRTIPSWVYAVKSNAEGLDERCLPTARSSRGLAKLAAAASACPDCPTPPRRAKYRPRELLTMARAVFAAAARAEFVAWRETCRHELAALGDVVSGMCSCTEFVAGWR